MVSVVIYGIIAIALAGAAGYAILTLTSTSQETTQLTENQVRLEQAVTALRGNLRALTADGTLYVPAGQIGTGTYAYNQLPSFLGVVGSSPWGTPFLYCPISSINSSLSPTTSATITSTSNSYTVSAYNSATTSNQSYVVSTGTGSTPPFKFFRSWHSLWRISRLCCFHFRARRDYAELQPDFCWYGW